MLAGIVRIVTSHDDIRLIEFQGAKPAASAGQHSTAQGRSLAAGVSRSPVIQFCYNAEVIAFLTPGSFAAALLAPATPPPLKKLKVSQRKVSWQSEEGIRMAFAYRPD